MKGRHLRRPVRAVLWMLTAFLAGASVRSRQEVLLEAVHAPVSRADEYKLDPGEPPCTLAQWQAVNPEVRLLLKFPGGDDVRVLPVLETHDGEYYMNHNLYHQYDCMGALFADAALCPLAASQNWIISGHSSKTQDWNLTFLKQYAEAEYYRLHPFLEMEEESGTSRYRVASFGRYDLEKEETCLDWTANQFADRDAVLEMFRNTEPHLLNHTDGLQYQGQRILTVVTCDMDSADARFVLQALEEV